MKSDLEAKKKWNSKLMEKIGNELSLKEFSRIAVETPEL